MSKGGGTTRQVTQTLTDPTTAPFKEFGLGEARRLYEAGPQQYYPGQTVVGFSPESQAALAGIRQQAITGSPFIGAVQDVVMQNLMGTNPLQSAAFRPAIEAVEAQAAKARRYGSGYQQAAVAEALAPYAYQAQQAAIQQAPAVRQFGFADLETLAGVGAAREAQAQAELTADIERFQFEQQAPQAALANYLAAVQGGELGRQEIKPVYRQPALSALGGALTGAKIGGMMTPQGTAVSPMYALGGGLLGAFGA